MSVGYTIGPYTVYQPQAIVVLDDSAMEAGNNVNDITIGILGTSTGGKPGVPLEFVTARDARRTLVDGPLPQAIERAYNPGVQPGAYRVVAIRLDGDTAISGNVALQATLSLKDDGGSANAAKIDAIDYGTIGNAISVLVEAPTTTGAGRNITVFAGGAEISGVDIGASGIDVQYTGTATAATVTVTATALTTTCTGVSGDNQNLLFSTYNTLQKLVDALNATGKYTAAVLWTDPTALSTTLDLHAAQDVLAAPVDLKRHLQYAIDWLNIVAGEFVLATKLGTATTGLLNIIPRTYLAAGRDPTITNNSWQQALDVLSGVECRLVAATTGDATIHAMIDAHVQEMSSPINKRERRAVLGGVAGETAAQAQTRAVALNSDRTQLIFPGIKDTDGSTLAPYFAACQLAGISAGLRPGFSKTTKFIRAGGIETALSEAQINTLEQRGICTLKLVTGKGVKIVHDRTTWLRDGKKDRIEMATGLVLDRVIQAVRDTAEARIGEPATPAIKNIIAGDIASVLTALTAQGFLVGDSATPSYRNLTVTVVADRVDIAVEVSVAVPMNFIAITIKATVFSSLS